MNPGTSSSFGLDYHRVILNAMPCPVFIVESDVRIIDFNAAAGMLLDANREEVIHQRAGEILHCLHSTESPEGCGHAPACKDCPVRNLVNCALLGESPQRRTARLQLLPQGQLIESLFLITVAPLVFENVRLAVVILEDIQEIALLRQMLPICSHCKQVRADKNYWQSVESYLAANLEIDCTHSLCPECAEKLFPEYAQALKMGEEQGKPSFPAPNTPEGAP